VARPAILDPALRLPLVTRGLRLELLTVGWNVIEAAVAIGAALLAGSVALLGFGADSVVESLSGLVLIWRLRAEATGSADEDDIERVENRAAPLGGIAFLGLAAYVAFDGVSAIVQGERPDPSPIGVAVTALSIPVMLWLAGAKRRVGKALGSRALVADAMQTQACWYLSVVTLVGLVVNALFGAWWADPVAGLGVAVLLVREGMEAIRGEEDDDEDDDDEDDDEDDDGDDDNDEGHDADDDERVDGDVERAAVVRPHDSGAGG
jgi:divalent metal cation (Fe/Co/Zn/Cd) transporter